MPIPARRRPASLATALLCLGLVTLLLLIVYVGWGNTLISPVQVLRELFSGRTGATTSNTIVWEIRLPRALITLAVGGLLATVGSAFQGLLRNPLADPYIVGVSSGAGFGAILALIGGFGAALGGLGTSLAGFLGGLFALALAIGFSSGRRGLDVRTLLLAGVVTGSMLSALLSLLMLSSGHDTNQLLQFLLGDTSHGTWSQVGLLYGVLVVGFILLLFQSRSLNAFAVGEETAHRLGVDPRRLKAIVLLTGTAMTAVAVGTVGLVGFVGLVAPHVARGIVGTDWRRSMPASLLLGGALLVGSDLIAQRAFYPTEIPLGIVTALLGSPFLLVMLRKS